MHTQEPGNLGRLLVLADELAGVCDLLGRQGRGAAKPDALRLRGGPAGTRALVDQAALELGNAGEECQHHAPGRRRRVGPRLGQRSQAGPSVADPLGNVEKIARRSGEAIKPRHRHHVAGLQMVQHLRQLGAAALRAGCLFLEHALAAGRFQRRALLVEGLAIGRDAGISDHHGAGGFRCYAHRSNLAGASRRENPYSATVACFGIFATDARYTLNPEQSAMPMSTRPKAIFNWSGGKDSALALYETLEEGRFEIVSLLTTIDQETDHSSVHAIPIDLLSKQSQSIGIPLRTVALATDLSGYAEKIGEIARKFRTAGVSHFIFGDLSLSEAKTYREGILSPLGIEVVEPLWNRTSAQIIDEFLASGIRAKIVMIRADRLDETYIGRELDRSLVDGFPDGVDPCGENGEYHTFAYAGGVFRTPVDFSISGAGRVSYDIGLSEGLRRRFDYWQALLRE